MALSLTQIPLAMFSALRNRCIPILISINELPPIATTAPTKQPKGRSVMPKRIITTLLCSTLGLIGATGLAHSDSIGRYECNVLGIANPEPLGDRAGHGLQSIQFSCVGVDGLVKGAVYSGNSVTEWDGTQGTILMSGGVHRLAGGFAVGQMTEGASSVIMKDEKLVGVTGSGKTIFKFASGTLAALSGKTLKFSNKSIGFNRFDIEFTE